MQSSLRVSVGSRAGDVFGGDGFACEPLGVAAPSGLVEKLAIANFLSMPDSTRRRSAATSRSKRGARDRAAVRSSESGSRSGTRAGAARREAIFAAALRLFRERGFHATSINDIGAAAGVTGPALYRHFAGKGEVLSEAIREGMRRIGAVTREAQARDDLPPRQALEELVGAHLRVALENADMYAAYVLELRHVSDEVRAPLHRGERRLRDVLKNSLQAVRPEVGDDEARTLVNMAIFSVASLCMVPSRMDDDSVVALATERITALLVGPPAG